MVDPVERYFSYLAVEKGLSKNTLEAYRRDLKKFTSFLEAERIFFPLSVS
jgi:integrase/recombinase XerD